MPGSLRPTGDNTVCDIRPEPVRASTRVVWRRTIEWKTSMGSVSCARMKFSGDSNHSRCQYSRCSNNSSSARRGFCAGKGRTGQTSSGESSSRYIVCSDVPAYSDSCTTHSLSAFANSSVSVSPGNPCIQPPRSLDTDSTFEKAWVLSATSR